MDTGNALYVFVAVPRQADLDFVLSVNGECVAERLASTGAERHALKVILLGQIRGQVEGVAAGGPGGDADSQTADAPRRGQVALQQRGREIADGDVVKTMTGLVGGQQVGDIHINGQQVPDRVLVLRTIQAAKGIGAAGVQRKRIEGRFNRLHRRRVGGLRWAGDTGRRHGPSTKPAEHLLPTFRMFGGRGRLQVEIPLARGAAVTAEAVFVDELTLQRLRCDGKCNRPQAIRGREREAAHGKHYIRNGIEYC
jgi:hypothetical protein